MKRRQTAPLKAEPVRSLQGHEINRGNSGHVVVLEKCDVNEPAPPVGIKSVRAGYLEHIQECGYCYYYIFIYFLCVIVRGSEVSRVGYFKYKQGEKNLRGC